MKWDQPSSLNSPTSPLSPSQKRPFEFEDEDNNPTSPMISPPPPGSKSQSNEMAYSGNYPGLILPSSAPAYEDPVTYGSNYPELTGMMNFHYSSSIF